MDSKSQSIVFQKRKLPAIKACMTKKTLDEERARRLLNLKYLNANEVMRMRRPLHECIIKELLDLGFLISADYLRDLIYDNNELLKQDDIGITTDIKKKSEYLEEITVMLKAAESAHDKDDVKKESNLFLALAIQFSNRGKGLLWLADRLYLAALAIARKYTYDGGRQHAFCRYHYACFLFDKYPEPDFDETNDMLTVIKDLASGRNWLLYERGEDTIIAPEGDPDILLITAVLYKMHEVLLYQARLIRNTDLPKSLMYCKQAAKAAAESGNPAKEGEALFELALCEMLSSNNDRAATILEKALAKYSVTKNIQGTCEAKMLLASVLQNQGKYEEPLAILTETGKAALENGLRKTLGKSMHLIGELHLCNRNSALGTQYLAEAFNSFMGYFKRKWEGADIDFDTDDQGVKILYSSHIPKVQTFITEAEHSRFMNAVSGGQEIIEPYFNLITKSKSCAVARSKIIEWNLNHANITIKRPQDDFVVCLCPEHNRTGLAVAQLLLDMKANKELGSTESIQRTKKYDNMRGERQSEVSERSHL